ncbi:hypothetical protein GCM10010841_32760 [Deinococcus aerophilus]|uniref:Transposase n=1 Tax=Deinococcus aerophilus TaxID=522488 RepID=A0ABQ2H152_9DEIO|nr:hypothetical protein GCM10010841_32760 [Deinococcus aerophilus]
MGGPGPTGQPLAPGNVAGLQIQLRRVEGLTFPLGRAESDLVCPPRPTPTLVAGSGKIPRQIAQVTVILDHRAMDCRGQVLKVRDHGEDVKMRLARAAQGQPDIPWHLSQQSL